MLTSRDMPSDSIDVLKAEPGKLDIKSREFISLPIGSLFKLVIMTSVYRVSCRFNVNDDVIQKSATSS